MGPLAGVRIVEIAGLGAAPYGCMMLADMGAEVVRVDRVGGKPDTPENSPLLRNRRSVALDLKSPQGRDAVLAMVVQGGRADRGVPSGRRGAARHRPRRLPGAQCATRLRPHDGLGADRTAGQRRDTISTTSG